MNTLVEKIPFTELATYKKLKILAEHPLDLTTSLTPERLTRFQAESGAFKMFFGTERISDEVLQGLTELAKECRAIEKMEKMQNGEIVNFIEGFPSENRAALHTALRDFFESPNTHKTAQEAAQLAKAEVDKIQKFEPKMAPFTDLVLVGIGGSELGPEANYLAIKAFEKPNRRVHFIGNVDPDNTETVLKPLDLSKTLVMVVSKSGTTLETVTNEALVQERFKKAGIDPKNHFIAATGEGSPMDVPSKYLASFYFWDWVGGRYSASSVIGGVIFTFALGFEGYMEFLLGAHDMDKAALNPDIKENIPLLGGLIEIWNRNFLGHDTLAIIPYSQGLSRYSAHVEQVEMESNGKHIDRHGERIAFETAPIYWGEPGTNGQHSFFQMLHQGTTIVPIEFIGFKNSQFNQDLSIEGTTSQEKLLSNLMGQVLALAMGQKNQNPNKGFEGNRPSHILFAERLTPYVLGSLFAYFEHKVAFEGFIWNINSFDQEGVQLGKTLANRFIDIFKKKKGGDSKTEPTPLELSLYDLLYTN